MNTLQKICQTRLCQINQAWFKFISALDLVPRLNMDDEDGPVGRQTGNAKERVRGRLDSDKTQRCPSLATPFLS